MKDNKEERLKILDLLASGKITPQEAEMLLNVLKEDVKVEPLKQTVKNNPFKMLRIQVDSIEGEKIRLNIPIEFAKLLNKGKFGNLNLREHGIDLDSIIDLVGGGAEGEILSVETEEGTKIKIFVA